MGSGERSEYQIRTPPMFEITEDIALMMEKRDVIMRSVIRYR